MPGSGFNLVADQSLHLLHRPRSSPPGDRGVCGFPDLQRLPEVGNAARQRSPRTADPHRAAVHVCVSGQGGRHADVRPGKRAPNPSNRIRLKLQGSLFGAFVLKATL